MEHYKVDVEQKWDYENGFYLTCETGRIGKLLNHLEIYRKIIDLPGEIAEFGVYKGSSLVRMLTFRELLETQHSRKIYGFDMFGKFPNNVKLKSDHDFIDRFEGSGGWGISLDELEILLQNKGFRNYELIGGDINETLVEFLEYRPAVRFALIHVDVDVYEPTKTILEKAYDRLVPGGILMLDDYNTVTGETLAAEEFFAGSKVVFHKPPYYHVPAYVIKE